MGLCLFTRRTAEQPSAEFHSAPGRRSLGVVLVRRRLLPVDRTGHGRSRCGNGLGPLTPRVAPWCYAGHRLDRRRGVGDRLRWRGSVGDSAGRVTPAPDRACLTNCCLPPRWGVPRDLTLTAHCRAGSQHPLRARRPRRLAAQDRRASDLDPYPGTVARGGAWRANALTTVSRQRRSARKRHRTRADCGGPRHRDCAGICTAPPKTRQAGSRGLVTSASMITSAARPQPGRCDARPGAGACSERARLPEPFLSRDRSRWRRSPVPGDRGRRGWAEHRGRAADRPGARPGRLRDRVRRRAAARTCRALGPYSASAGRSSLASR